LHEARKAVLKKIRAVVEEHFSPPNRAIDFGMPFSQSEDLNAIAVGSTGFSMRLENAVFGMERC
jgi:hypothetical protein